MSYACVMQWRLESIVVDGAQRSIFNFATLKLFYESYVRANLKKENIQLGKQLSNELRTLLKSKNKLSKLQQHTVRRH